MGLLDKFRKTKRVEDNGLFGDFLKAYPPSSKLEKPKQDFLEKASKIVPAELITFWETYGFGSYGNGLIKIINPTDYMGCLYTWLGKEDFSKIPIMVTAFGDIIYYRKLSPTEDDICILNVHYRTIEVLAYSFKEFWQSIVTDEKRMTGILYKEMYEQAVASKGALQDSEIFYFVPALVLGGKVSVSNIDKGDAVTHLQLLFEVGN